MKFVFVIAIASFLLWLIVVPVNRVIIENYVGLTDTANGLGIYTAHYFDGKRVLLLDTVCMHGVGDTVTPKYILQ